MEIWQPHGDACDRFSPFHGGNKYPLYPQLHAGDPSKGLSEDSQGKAVGERLVIGRHALRNGLVPVVTVIGMQIPLLFGGAVIVEQLFSWPGLGLMTMSAILSRDYPVIMGVCLLAAVVVLAANLVTDILYAVVDPSIQYD